MKQINKGYNWGEVKNYDDVGQMYVVMSIVMLTFISIPILGYIPITLIAIRKLRAIDKNLFKGSMCKVSFVVMLLELFLISRLAWY